MGENNWISSIIAYLLGFGLSVLVLTFPFIVHINTGEKVYTGYVYSVAQSFGVTEGHIRLSEDAGGDNQPSFCVDEGLVEKLQELAGSGKKVKVKEPAGFKIAGPWECAFPVEIKVLEDK